MGFQKETYKWLPILLILFSMGNIFWAFVLSIGGEPLFLSHPHFLFMGERFQSMVLGLTPDPELHWGYLDLHSTTGIPIIAQQRLQFNLHVRQWRYMPTFANISETYLPVLWIEEGVTLVGTNKLLIQLLSLVEMLWPLGVAGMFFNGIVIGPGITYLLLKRRQTKPTQESSESLRSASVTSLESK